MLIIGIFDKIVKCQSLGTGFKMNFLVLHEKMTKCAHMHLMNTFVDLSVEYYILLVILLTTSCLKCIKVILNNLQ